MILVVKSQPGPGLFDKIVPIAGSTSVTGTFTAPHYARRKVRLAEATPAEKPRKPEGPAKSRAHAASAIGDMFAASAHAAPKREAPAPETAPKKKKAETPKEGQKPGPDLFSATIAGEIITKPAPDAHVGPRLEIDFNEPFDTAAVPAFGVLSGTSKERRREINAQCQGLIDGRQEFDKPTRRLLRQYSGRGGCGDSLNEFYTDPKVAAAAWYVLRRLGLPEGAEVLEPSCATGVFLETKPAGVHVVGVELDGTSAAIGAVLHPGDDVINSSLEGFAVSDDRQFDSVIGNVPFGLRGRLIKDDKPSLKTAEAYFLDTAIDKTKPGGVVALIVPTGVLDGSNNRALRERLMRKADFMGALRMPNTAFEHSHTGVTTDLVFFRKRPEDVAQALMTVKQPVLQKLGVWDEEYLAGDYFTGRGAPNVLGTMTQGWRAKAGMGDDITVEGSMAGVPAAIAQFQPENPVHANLNMASIIEALDGDQEAQASARAAALKRPYDNAKVGDIKTVDGVQYILQGKPPRWHRMDEYLQSAGVTDAQGLATDIQRAMNGEPVDDLAERVKAYVEKHGIPAKNKDLLIAAGADKTLYRLIGAVRDDGSLSDVIAGRRGAIESSFDSAAQALAVEVGDFTPEQIAGRWAAGDADVALDHLYASPNYALNPDGRWTTTDAYLSGELWPKLDDASAALAGDKLKPEDRAKLERQKALLEETIDPKALEDVEIALNSAFIPLRVVASFFNDKKNAYDAAWAKNQPDMSITFDKGIYTIKGGLWDSSLLDKYLNRTGVRKDDWPKIEEWNHEFKDWLCASKFRDEVENIYNRSFRGFRQKAYSETPFEIPGLAAATLNGYHYSGIRQALAQGKGIIAADVGLGKTVRALILARLAKLSGQANKPIIVVPKSVLANWVAEVEKWFPGSSVMAIGETFTRDADGKLKGDNDSPAERARKLHDITQNDYDFILISQPAWNDIDLNPETKIKYAEDDFWVQRGDSLQNAGDKRINQIRTSYEQYMATRDFQKRTDVIYFDDLGIDMIVGDEGHAYKNLYAAKNRFGESPKFLGGQGLSNRALDMQFKSRFVRERNGGNNVYLLTATPTKNSPLEVYSMLAHIAPEAFEKIGIRNSEEFLDRFCDFKREMALNTSGQIEEMLVTAGFKNLDELREIMRRYIDRKTAEDVGLVLPKRDDREHLIEMTPQQKLVYADLREMAATAKADAKGDAHIFSVMDKMSKAAMDLELYDAKRYAGATSPKYDAAAKEIVAGLQDGGQVVFADSVDVHQKMVDALVRGGVPRNQIAVINARVAKSAAQRQNISDDFNAGKLRVVIGNTATMGEGVNLQKGTTDIHHLDLPWEPASIQQRNGRGLRQGNIKESVRIHSYIAKGSFDGYRYQCLAAKKNWQDLLWNGGDRVENLAREGNFSRDEMMIMLAADPDAARKAYESDKTAASARFEAEKHTAAANQFTRLQEMRRSFGALKNKETTSANRLRVKIDRARAALDADPYFKAKQYLDSKEPVIVHPQTGAALTPGAALEIPKGDESVNCGGKFVITSVIPGAKMVWARPYAGSGSVAFGIEMLRDAKPIEYNEADESAEVAKQMAESAKSKMGEVKQPGELVGLPDSIIESSHAALQSQIKTALKEYAYSPRHGAKIALLTKDGAPVLVDTYEGRKQLDEHDVMLPTSANRAKAIAAFAESERAKDFRMDTPVIRGRRGSTKEGAARLIESYPGGYGERSNQWSAAGREVFGDGFPAEARLAFESEQNARARRAANFSEAISAVVPTVEVGYSDKPTWHKKALATLWAHAKKNGELSLPFMSLVPLRGGTGYGSDRPKYPKQLFGATDAASVREVLTELARESGHRDLAGAMLSSSPNPDKAIESLFRMPIDTQTGTVLRHILERHPEVARRRAVDVVGWYTKVSDLPEFKGGKWGSVTMAEVADALSDNDNDEGGGDERIAA